MHNARDDQTAARVTRETRRYLDGEIGLSEFEVRIERLLDPARRPPLTALAWSERRSL